MMLSRFILTGCFALGFFTFLSAQEVFLQKDSLRLKYLKDSSYVYRNKKYRPYADIDQYQTFINDANVTLRGFSLGIRYNNTHVFALALHGIIPRDQRKAIARFRDTATVNEQLGLRYVSILYQYTLINNRYMAVFFPTQLGLGRYNITIDNASRTQRITTKSGGTIPASVGATLVLKPVKWVGVSGTGGYRMVLDRNPNLNFSGLFYGYGIWLDIQQIIRDVRFYGFVRPKYRRQSREQNKIGD
jgi:hypothetical protein